MKAKRFTNEDEAVVVEDADAPKDLIAEEVTALRATTVLTAVVAGATAEVERTKRPKVSMMIF